MTNYIILGRFQPFHIGHEFLVNEAAKLVGKDDKITIAIGSAQAGGEMLNPWFADERKAMIEQWIESQDAGLKIDIVTIEDINDPPNWVEHAKQFHGEGVLVSSDEMTLELYNKSNFGTIHITLQNRQNLAGWRVRNSAKMVSTIYDDQAVRQVLGESIPKPVIDWLIDNDALFRLSTMVGAVVG